MGLIYVLKNSNNSKCYVGQTTLPFKKRFSLHKENRSIGKKLYITNALKKHGEESFISHQFYVPDELLNFFECEMIKRLKTLAPGGYNLTTGGKVGYTYSQDVRERMSKNSARYWLGRKKPQHVVDAIAKAQRGKVLRLEHRKKISEALKGKITRSEDFKRRVRENQPAAKRVLCIETGTIFAMISEAMKWSGINRANISKVCRKKRPTAGGYHWSYVN